MYQITELQNSGSNDAYKGREDSIRAGNCHTPLSVADRISRGECVTEECLLKSFSTNTLRPEMQDTSLTAGSYYTHRILNNHRVHSLSVFTENDQDRSATQPSR